MLSKPKVGLIAVAASAFCYVVYSLLDRRSWLRELISRLTRGPWIEVGTVSELFIYPVKSCRGTSVPDAYCTQWGLQNGQMIDRNFLLINKEDGKFITGRQYPRMILVEPAVADQTLTLKAPDTEPMEVDLVKIRRKNVLVKATLWRNRPIEGYDCGHQAAQWFQKFLEMEKECRLIHFVPGLLNERQINLDPKWKLNRSDKSAFADLTPYMLATQGTLDNLNERLLTTGHAVMRNFRPNIAVMGTAVHDEDRWSEVRIGNQVSMTNVKPCTRCIMTTIDTRTGIKDSKMEPLRTLKWYRLAPPEQRHIFGDSPIFGINLAIDSQGPITIGDPVYVRYF